MEYTNQEEFKKAPFLQCRTNNLSVKALWNTMSPIARMEHCTNIYNQIVRNSKLVNLASSAGRYIPYQVRLAKRALDTLAAGAMLGEDQSYLMLLTSIDLKVFLLAHMDKVEEELQKKH